MTFLQSSPIASSSSNEGPKSREKKRSQGQLPFDSNAEYAEKNDQATAGMQSQSALRELHQDKFARSDTTANNYIDSSDLYTQNANISSTTTSSAYNSPAAQLQTQQQQQQQAFFHQPRDGKSLFTPDLINLCLIDY